MKMITKPTALTEEALKNFSLRIAGDGTEKGLEKVIGTAVTVDENIPHAFAEDDGKSIMGFPSVSEVGEGVAEAAHEVGRGERDGQRVRLVEQPCRNHGSTSAP